jgi:hypothetical protein
MLNHKKSWKCESIVQSMAFGDHPVPAAHHTCPNGKHIKDASKLGSEACMAVAFNMISRASMAVWPSIA